MDDTLQQVERTHVLWRGRKLVYFAGCDYYRLASHPRILAALEAGLRRDGLNVAASRLTTGEHPIYGVLEGELAKWFGASSALLASTGYLTNLIVAQAMEGQFSHVFLDARAHLSLRDASRMFGAPVIEFAHADADDLARRLKRLRGRIKPALLTDGVFSNNGEVAPLRQYLEVLPREAIILLDDAHSAGVLGANGMGTIEYAGVTRRRIIQTITLSKAFGVYGGAILHDTAARGAMFRRSPIFAGSTPLPLPLAEAAREALKLLRQDVSLRCRLSHNVQHVKAELRGRGWTIPETPSPIIALSPLRPSASRALRERLLERGIFPSLIRYPGGPPEGYFRFVLSSEHTHEHLNVLLDSLREVR